MAHMLQGRALKNEMAPIIKKHEAAVIAALQQNDHG